jgi:hypothetical protein
MQRDAKRADKLNLPSGERLSLIPLATMLALLVRMLAPIEMLKTPSPPAYAEAKLRLRPGKQGEGLER